MPYRRISGVCVLVNGDRIGTYINEHGEKRQYQEYNQTFGSIFGSTGTLLSDSRLHTSTAEEMPNQGRRRPCTLHTRQHFFSSFVVCFRSKPPNCRFWAFFGSDLGEAKDDPAGTLHYAKPAFLREAVFGRFCAKAVFKQM